MVLFDCALALRPMAIPESAALPTTDWPPIATELAPRARAAAVPLAPMAVAPVPLAVAPAPTAVA
ncbi:hypothetical protein SAMN05443579_109163 [Variovorax sp. PDC80]|nr:hypothetical protein SAMN05443579_109163 [Variovorax sp. PDC80]